MWAATPLRPQGEQAGASSVPGPGGSRCWLPPWPDVSGGDSWLSLDRLEIYIEYLYCKRDFLFTRTQTVWLLSSPRAEMLRGFGLLRTQLGGGGGRRVRNFGVIFVRRGRLEHRPAAGTEQCWRMRLCQAEGAGHQHLPPSPCEEWGAPGDAPPPRADFCTSRSYLNTRCRIETSQEKLVFLPGVSRGGRLGRAEPPAFPGCPHPSTPRSSTCSHSPQLCPGLSAGRQPRDRFGPVVSVPGGAMLQI